LIHYRKFDMVDLRRWTALCCLFLALLRVGIEATHLHADTAAPQTSDRCLVCLSIQPNASATAFHPLPVLRVLEIVALPHRTEGKSRAAEIDLFIRPPPIL